MKVLAYIPIHYGLEYLAYTIESIDAHVDEILCLYTEKPSYGHETYRECPEKEAELKQLAHDTSSKIRWIKVNARSEGHHRNIPFNYVKGHDILLTLDTDEVWHPDQVEQAIQDARNTDSRYIGIDGFVNFWRSFHHVVIDWFQPVRIHNLRTSNRVQGTIKSTIYHFGYAQNDEIMKYKFQVHGHKNEIDKNYLNEKYFAWNEPKCGVEWLHPASDQIWQDAEPYTEELPDLLKRHPNFEKAII